MPLKFPFWGSHQLSLGEDRICQKPLVKVAWPLFNKFRIVKQFRPIIVDIPFCITNRRFLLAIIFRTWDLVCINLSFASREFVCARSTAFAQSPRLRIAFEVLSIGVDTTLWESRVLYRQRTDHVGCFCFHAIVKLFLLLLIRSLFVIALRGKSNVFSQRRVHYTKTTVNVQARTSDRDSNQSSLWRDNFVFLIKTHASYTTRALAESRHSKVW